MPSRRRLVSPASLAPPLPKCSLRRISPASPCAYRPPSTLPRLKWFSCASPACPPKARLYPRSFHNIHDSLPRSSSLPSRTLLSSSPSSRSLSVLFFFFLARVESCVPQLVSSALDAASSRKHIECSLKYHHFHYASPFRFFSIFFFPCLSFNLARDASVALFVSRLCCLCFPESSSLGCCRAAASEKGIELAAAAHRYAWPCPPFPPPERLPPRLPSRDGG